MLKTWIRITGVKKKMDFEAHKVSILTKGCIWTLNYASMPHTVNEQCNLSVESEQLIIYSAY